MPQSKHLWYRSRGYLHFDNPIGLKKAEKIVSNKHLVAQHAFYPLISYSLKSIKIFKDGNGILKDKEKIRPISYAAHLDSQIYSYYAKSLSDIYEEQLKQRGISDSIIAFRKIGKGKCNIDFANDAFEEIKSRKRCSVLALDITGFFDNLDHGILKNMWSNLLETKKLPSDHFNIFSSLTQFSFVERTKLYDKFGISKNNPKRDRTRVCEAKEFREIVRKSGLISVNPDKKGIPQGTPISALLSNIYMLDFDNTMTKIVLNVGGVYFRYCDDMLFIIPTEHRDNIEQLVISEIAKLNLEINIEKTEKRDFYIKNKILHCNKPLQYLGFTFDGQRKLIRSAALAKFSGRMKTGVRMAKSAFSRNKSSNTGTELQKSRLLKKKIYERYSHLSRRNFLTYGYRASRIMASQEIRKQLKPLWGRLQEEINKPVPAPKTKTKLPVFPPVKCSAEVAGA